MDRSRRRFLATCGCLAAGILGQGLWARSASPARGAGDMPAQFQPAYLKLQASGELKKRGQQLWEMMAECQLCPRQCGVNRLAGEQGICQATSQLEISTYGPHFGEERPLVGLSGSGTIFLTNCGLRCVFCINWDTS